jgi:putative iron-regulated protein
MKAQPRGLALSLLLLAGACGDSDSGDNDQGRQGAAFPLEAANKTIADYKDMVFRNYGDVVREAERLKVAIDAFLANPSEETQKAAQNAWLAARLPYGPSEVYRFYDGPIDSPETGLEGEINAWPLDENYIDYTRDQPTAGLINDLTGTPEITLDVIKSANEAAGEKAISTGYHAIEFLLWGQDDLVAGQGAGKRSYTDYVEGGSASNPARRKQYLSLVTDLLLADLKEVAAQWDPANAQNFAAGFGKGGEEASKDAISKLLLSLGSLSKAELSGERMTVAYKNGDQEDEHSCFSDNTASDLLGNGQGLRNVWLGSYGGLDKAGLDEVVAAVDADLAQKMTTDIDAAIAKLEALENLQKAGKPIDVVISSGDSSPERKTMLDAIQALKLVADDVEDAAKALGLSVVPEEPSEEL